MGHYNSTHAVLEEKKHGFEIALLQVRNVKQSSYFRWQWEPELFLANQPSLQAMKEKEICAVRSLQSPASGHSLLVFYKGQHCKVLVLPVNASFHDLLFEHTFLLQSLLCYRWLNRQSLALYPSREHPRLTKQLHYWNTTSRNSSVQMRWYHKYVLYFSKLMKVVVWCILLQVPTTPHRRGQNLIVSIN